MLGGNLGSLLYGDVSVMSFKTLITLEIWGSETVEGLVCVNSEEQFGLLRYSKSTLFDFT